MCRHFDDIAVLHSDLQRRRYVVCRRLDLDVLCGLRTCLTPLLQDMVYSLTTFFTWVDSIVERESWLSIAELGVQWSVGGWTAGLRRR
jgi:hypothetical protein